MRTLRRPTVIAALTAAAILFSAGGAYGYLTATGAGVGTVSVATAKPLVIEQLDVTDLALGRTADLTAKVTNPNDFEASLLATVITVKVTADADHKGCDIKNFEVTAPSTTAKLIEPKNSLELDNGSITLLNTPLDQAACQGAILTLSYLLDRAPSSPTTTAVSAVPTTAPKSVAQQAPNSPSTTESTPASSVQTTAGSAATPTADPFASTTAAQITTSTP